MTILASTLPLKSYLDVDLVWQDPAALEEAVLKTIAYADVFDYPLTPAEIYHYLIGVPAAPDEVKEVVSGSRYLRTMLDSADGVYFLRGRNKLVSLRSQRAEIAASLWPRARQYGRLISSLPYVRMVAVTGSLAANNPTLSGDIDYLVVTTPGRVWLCRALVILLVRWAAQVGDTLCPNYFLSMDALASTQRSLYHAHEIAHMVPLSGLETYSRLRQLNSWTLDYLPNAAFTPPGTEQIESTPENKLRTVFERGFSGELGGRLDRWEMQRKVKRFARQQADAAEAAFCCDWCKGHFENHGHRSLAAYRDNLQRLGLNTIWHDIAPVLNLPNRFGDLPTEVGFSQPPSIYR